MYRKRVPANARVERLDFCSFIEKIFTYMIVYGVRGRLKVEKNISRLMKILAMNRFMPYWIILIVVMRKK